MIRSRPMLAVWLSAAAGASAQVAPDYDFQWRAIRAAGNRSANQAEAPEFHPPGVDPPLLAGSVGYEYRMSRLEVTNTQWLEFLNAYWPQVQGSYNDPSLVGTWIRASNNVPGQNPDYFVVAGAANRAATMSWRSAAIYCNWLTNNKELAASAFNSGAYDVSTFVTNPDGTVQDQQSHSPGALFWIPTLDEWTKGMYYDPDRYGQGQGGYWPYPTRSEVLFSGPPGTGLTSAGMAPPPWFDVGAYSQVQSPWGLLDGSSSVGEWTEMWTPYDRYIKGSEQGSGIYLDRIDHLSAGLPYSAGPGMRLASAVPAPATGMLLLAAGFGGVAGGFKRTRKVPRGPRPGQGGPTICSAY